MVHAKYMYLIFGGIHKYCPLSLV